ncbi:MAG: M50 family metallopeptidase [Firmicutes bacterium]|nr:M50 family metallopeptidase [Bacillota bacterium]
MIRNLRKVRIHPLFGVVVAVAYFGHFLGQVGVLFAVVILHELGHVLAAHKCGYRTESVELLPFGGVARLECGTLGWHPRQEVVIAASGPIVNGVLMMLASALHLLGWLPDDATSSFVAINGTVLLFNLLPALPLDGGRIARAGISSGRGYYVATRMVIIMSFVLSCVLMATGALSLWLGFTDAGVLALGLFLLVSAWSLARDAQYDLMRFLDAKQREHPSRPQALHPIAVAGDATVADVARTLRPDAYHVVYVRNVQPDEGFAGVVSEDALLRGIFEQGMWTKPIRELL